MELGGGLLACILRFCRGRGSGRVELGDWGIVGEVARDCRCNATMPNDNEWSPY